MPSVLKPPPCVGGKVDQASGERHQGFLPPEVEKDARLVKRAAGLHGLPPYCLQALSTTLIPTIHIGENIWEFG